MSRIVVNKNFNKQYLSKSMEDFLSPQHQNIIDRRAIEPYNYYNNYYNYTGGFIGGNLKGAQNAMWFVVTKSYLELIDKVNKLFYDGIVSGSIDYSHRFFNSLTTYKKSERKRLWSWLKTHNHITDDEFNVAVGQCEAFGQIKYSSISWTYNESSDYFTMLHNSPMNLETRWDNSVNNTSGGEIFIMSILQGYENFNNENFGSDAIGGLQQSATKFIRDDTGASFYQLSYMAHTVTDRAGDGDIQFDYVDKIDYIDSLEISVKLPKEIS